MYMYVYLYMHHFEEGVSNNFKVDITSKLAESRKRLQTHVARGFSEHILTCMFQAVACTLGGEKQILSVGPKHVSIHAYFKGYV